MPSKFEVRNRLTVISGGSQGLGASLAKQIVLGGGDVVIVSRTESKLKAVVEELTAMKVSESQRISYIAADVTDATKCREVFEETGVPDNVICCAGQAVPGLLKDFDSETLEKHIKSVYFTAMHFSHAGFKAMVASGDFERARNIVYCSSVLAVFSFIGYGSYGPGKAAIRALADIMRQECLPYNISVANILPGNMATEGFEQEELTKPEITRKIEGPSSPRDPDEIAVEVMAELRRGKQMIFTDFIGWFLSGMMLGASPRNNGFVQTFFAIILAIFSPIWKMIIDRDIKNYFAK
ncbi:3-ketodihydrosphingosine reductase Tsc10p [Trichomonascus vanleenenianus]|uniref:3-dehydrosphinganine reductase n=1 Tax=Trichomonascus vanleenenianus TaxID=2268995 RepID=UPI003ECB20D3